MRDDFDQIEQEIFEYLSDEREEIIVQRISLGCYLDEKRRFSGEQLNNFYTSLKSDKTKRKSYINAAKVLLLKHEGNYHQKQIQNLRVVIKRYQSQLSADFKKDIRSTLDDSLWPNVQKVIESTIAAEMKKTSIVRSIISGLAVSIFVTIIVGAFVFFSGYNFSL